MSNTSFRLTPETDRQIKALAAWWGRTQTAVLTACVERIYQQEEAKRMATFTSRWFDADTKEVITDDIAAHNAYAVVTCDEDDTPVTIMAVGTAEYAQCRNGHRWQHNFVTNDQFVTPGWIPLQ